MKSNYSLLVFDEDLLNPEEKSRLHIWEKLEIRMQKFSQGCFDLYRICKWGWYMLMRKHLLLLGTYDQINFIYIHLDSIFLNILAIQISFDLHFRCVFTVFHLLLVQIYQLHWSFGLVLSTVWFTFLFYFVSCCKICLFKLQIFVFESGWCFCTVVYFSFFCVLSQKLIFCGLK